MSDLRRIADLLALQGQGVFVVEAVGETVWLTARFLRRTLPTLERLLWEREPTINVVPYARAGHYLERVPSSLLWVRTESGESASRLRMFKPAPAVVIREGATNRYVAFWALEKPLTPGWLDIANQRLRYALHAPRKHASDGFRVVLPGAVLRQGRGRSLPVELVRYEPELLPARAIVGRLRDAPDPDAWRKPRDAAFAS